MLCYIVTLLYCVTTLYYIVFHCYIITLLLHCVTVFLHCYYTVFLLLQCYYTVCTSVSYIQGIFIINAMYSSHQGLSHQLRISICIINAM